MQFVFLQNRWIAREIRVELLQSTGRTPKKFKLTKDALDIVMLSSSDARHIAALKPRDGSEIVPGSYRRTTACRMLYRTKDLNRCVSNQP